MPDRKELKSTPGIKISTAADYNEMVMLFVEVLSTRSTMVNDVIRHSVCRALMESANVRCNQSDQIKEQAHLEAPFFETWKEVRQGSWSSVSQYWQPVLRSNI